MNKRQDKYEVVNKLPANAFTVSQYAKECGFSTNYIYNLIRANRDNGKEIDFNIVTFHSINFIIPK